MTIGEKIRTSRVLRKMTQAELGHSVHLAGDRIRQYENNVRTPKENKLKEIATALDVDMSALSDINIASYEDIMHILFELEEQIGLEIEKIDGKTHLIIDDNNIDISSLICYLNAWYTQRKDYMTSEISDETQRAYNIWKARFPKDLKDYFQEQENIINDFYAPHIKSLISKKIPITKKSELVTQLRKMLEAGLSIQFSTKAFGIGKGSLVVDFQIKELLSNNQVKNECFAEFLFDLNVLRNYGMNIDTEVLNTDTGLHILYFLHLSPLSVISSTMKELQEHLEKKATLSDYSGNTFEMIYEENLKTYDLDLKEEIEHYNSK